MPAARFQVIVTATATADLDDIVDYWIEQGEAWRGDQYHRDLVDAAERELTNASTARRGRPIEIPGHQDARAILVFGVYRIIYRIDEAGGVVNLLRFWHAHRDVPPLE